ncbi:MAG: primosomal protein N' [Candidatus Rokuibacteriota bacterium]|nr:MAG: primosomal protein N' [Candidatus Rokubacteria bacterium]
MIADVAFDAPVSHPFSYRVPDGWEPAPGQRVLAPLRGAARVGMVVALREGDDARLKPLLRVADSTPILSPAQLDFASWIAAESLSSLGSTCAALLPPPLLDSRATGPGSGSGARHAPRMEPPAGAPRNAPERRPTLLVGAGREQRVLERIEGAKGGALVIAADVDTAARWAQRLAKVDQVVRLDSGVDEEVRAKAWRQLADGSARLATGTRSALLAPVAPPGTLVLLDEHEAAHKPPGPPRIHSRDVVLERAAREGATLLLTSATPSVEMWWRADSGRAEAVPAPPGPWPAVSLADTRGILRREPLTPALARAVRETLAAGRRVFLAVTRLTSALACDECGAIVRCAECALALACSRAAATLACRLCGRTAPLPDTCPSCQGRRLSPFGWGVERVEHAVRRRFPDARIARYDPDGLRGARGETQRAAAAAAQVVIGTRGALRLFGRATLGLAGFVSADQLLRVPDFRAGERTFALLWAAAERVVEGGALVIQSQNPTHYAFDAVVRQDLAAFYGHELRFRGELGYPPFRRLATLTVRGQSAPETERLAARVSAALRTSTALQVYPPGADRRNRVRRVVVKGPAELPRLVGAALEEFRGGRQEGRGIIDVEVDPVEWPF